MSLTLTRPLLGLDEAFPDRLFVAHHASTGRYGCFRHGDIHGLACFSTESGAVEFAAWIELAGMEVVQVTFEEARQVAKDRPPPVVSLMLLDDIAKPVIHFVR